MKVLFLTSLLSITYVYADDIRCGPYKICDDNYEFCYTTMEDCLPCARACGDKTSSDCIKHCTPYLRHLNETSNELCGDKVCDEASYCDISIGSPRCELCASICRADPDENNGECMDHCPGYYNKTKKIETTNVRESNTCSCQCTCKACKSDSSRMTPSFRRRGSKKVRARRSIACNDDQYYHDATEDCRPCSEMCGPGRSAAECRYRCPRYHF